MTIHEKRKVRRKSSSISIKLLENPGVLFHVHVEDVSATGICVKSPKFLAPDTRVLISMNHPFFGAQSRFDGKVKWTRPTENMWSSGIEFMNVQPCPEGSGIYYFIDDRMCEFVTGELPKNMVCRPAQDYQELTEAYRLVYREYLAQGYCKPHASCMHFNTHSMLPSSKAFVLMHKKSILGTVSLITDTICGLPMDSAFPALLGPLRFEGRKIAEVSLLTMDYVAFKSSRWKGFHKLAGSFWLFKTMMDYARKIAGVTDLVIAVHPKQEKLYRNLAFKPLGKSTPYALAGGSPGLPMRLDIKSLEKCLPVQARYKTFFFDDQPNVRHLHPSYDPAGSELSNLLQSKLPSLLRFSTHGPIEFLKRRYPEVALSCRN